MIKTVIVEDDTMFCDFLTKELGSYPECDILATYDDGYLAWNEISVSHPDFVILDIGLPSLNGIEILKRVKKAFPETHILLVSGVFTKNNVHNALKAGAEGMVEKTARLSDMREAIRQVLEGGTYYGPKIVSMMKEIMVDPKTTNPTDMLTIREKEVLQLVAEGHDTKEITKRLDIAETTTETHRANLMLKLDLHNIAELTRFAISQGIIYTPKHPHDAENDTQDNA